MATLRLGSRIAGLGLVCAAMLAGLASPAGAATFSGGPITINDFSCAQGPTTPYPSEIAVAGMAGTITDVNVTLTNLTHKYPSELRMLLVGPSGQTTALYEHAAIYSHDVTDLTFTLDDQAAGTIPNPFVAGTYQPTQDNTGDCDHFVPLAPPAPAGPYGTALSAFNGVSANGTWKLYIVDDIAVTAGDAEGWSIAITTTGTAQTTFSNTNPLTIADKDPEGDDDCPATPATPYPSSINVAGLTAAVTDVNVTLTNLTHDFPEEVRMLLVGPTGQSVLLMEDAGGDDHPTDVTFTLDDEAPGAIPDPLVAGTYQPTVTPDGCGGPYPSMPPPAPAAPYGTTLSAFDATNPNGTWKLYVVDQVEGDSGDIEGWSLDITTAPSYASSVLADTPTGYWRFGEPSGTTMLDSSGQLPADNGTYIGGVTLGQPGALAVDPNTAALYDGINDQGRVPDSNSLDVGNSFTAEGWIKRSSTAQSHELMNKGASGIHLVVMSGASLNRVLLRRAGVATIAQSTSGVPADGRFHHVVATMNGLGSTARIYIDGIDFTQVMAPGQTILNTAFPLTFGSFGSSPSQPATYDEFALYDAALSAARVQAHHAAGIGPV